MPTSTRGGTAAPPKPPTRAPVPPPAPAAPVRPDDRGGPRPAPPTPQAPLELPHPVLQRHGINLGITEFNQRVADVVDAHRHGIGRDPSPGIVLDVVRSPLDPADYNRLFEIPTTQRQARLAGIRQRTNEDLFIQRADGLFEPDNPLNRAVKALAGNVQTPDTSTPQESPQKHYPWVASGFLPVENFPQLIEAVRALSSPDEAAKVQHGGTTLGAFEKEYQAAGGSIADQAKVTQERQTVQTVKDAQTELNKLMGTSLPTTGFINQDWASAISNWQRSRDYFRKTTKFLADKSGLSVPEFAQAWRNQQRAVEHYPLAAHLYSSLPLRLWVHPNSTWGSGKDLGLYLKGTSDAPWNIALHGLTRSVGLTLDLVGGTVASAKADAAAANAFQLALVQHPGDLEEARAHAHKVLRENPSWLRVVDPSLAAKPKGWLKALDTVSNVAVDLIVLRKPALTGETVAYGDVPAALRSSYLHASSNMAYGYLKAGKVGRASALMEGGQGAERLATAAEPLIRRGLLSRGEFKRHLAELYANGETTLTVKGRTITVSGPALDSLRTAKLTTPGYSGQGWKIIEANARDLADKLVPTGARTDGAVNFANKLRASFSHAVAPGKHSLYDPRLPERIHDYALGTFKDPALANKWESDFVRARAHDDIPRMQTVFENVNELYRERFPVGSKESAPEPFKALLGTEAPSIARFPSGGQAEERYLAGVADSAKAANDLLNRIGRFHAKVIVSGAPFLYVGGRSLFYKHMIADTLRRAAGGGFILGKGLGRTAKKWETFLGENPEFERHYGAYLERNIKGETRWLLNRGQAVNRTSFETGEAFGKANYMDQAGGYLRRHLLDDAALDGYLRSTNSDMGPLVDAVLHDRELRGMWKSARRSEPGLSAEEYAGLVFDRYQGLREAGAAAGVDVFSDGMSVLRKNRGANVDKKLGQWIADNKIGFEVKGAQVAHVSSFDEVMNNAINHLMVFNKWNRGQMAKNVFLHHWGLATRAGMEPATAARVAMSVGERQTVYHMLDFANRLKIEQDLRWLSYFATKHRLYWKWLMGTFIRNPRYAAAVWDVHQHLSDKGAIDFESFGQKLSVPVARLFWVPGKEYSETSPVAGSVAAMVGGLARGEPVGGALGSFFNAAAGTNGNVFTRSDQGINLAVKWARTATGLSPATYGAATRGLPAKEAAFMARDLNEFQLNYYAEHGHYAPESEAVKHVLWASAAKSLWQSNLPLPVVPAGADKTGEQKLMAQFMGLNDPKKRREFMDAHPGFTDHFGIYGDPRIFLRNREYFARYTQELETYRQARQALFDRARAEGFTPAVMREKRALDAAFQKSFDGMLVQDAHESGIQTKGRVPNGVSVPYGRWGKLVEADPLLNPQTTLKALFPKLKPDQYGRIYGSLQKDLQTELRLLGDPEYAGTFDTPSEVKGRKREILQQLEVFRSYPKDALGRLQAKYILEHTNPFWKEYERRYQQIRSAPRTEQDGLKAQFYAWREAQDHPVVIDGVKFPSAARMAWATLDPQTRRERLSYLASANWDHLTDYEKRLLGEKEGKVAQGWLYLQEAKDAYTKENPGASVHRDQLSAVARQIDKVVPGFYKDYLFAQQPLVRRFETMSLYQDLPRPDRVKFDQYIGVHAKEVARATASGNYNSGELREGWVKYIDTQIVPWLDAPENASLRKRLSLYGPNFLHSLILK